MTPGCSDFAIAITSMSRANAYFVPTSWGVPLSCFRTTTVASLPGRTRPRPSESVWGSRQNETVPYDGFTPTHLSEILKENGFCVTQVNKLAVLHKNFSDYDIYMIRCTVGDILQKQTVMNKKTVFVKQNSQQIK